MHLNCMRNTQFSPLSSCSLPLSYQTLCTGTSYIQLNPFLLGTCWSVISSQCLLKQWLYVCYCTVVYYIFTFPCIIVSMSCISYCANFMFANLACSNHLHFFTKKIMEESAIRYDIVLSVWVFSAHSSIPIFMDPAPLLGFVNINQSPVNLG